MTAALELKAQGLVAAKITLAKSYSHFSSGPEPSLFTQTLIKALRWKICTFSKINEDFTRRDSSAGARDWSRSWPVPCSVYPLHTLLRAHHVATLSRGVAMSHAAGAGPGSEIFSVFPENQKLPDFARGLPATFRVCAGAA